MAPTMAQTAMRIGLSSFGGAVSLPRSIGVRSSGILALVYSLTTLLYVITQLVQAPFALTIAVALPSSL
jgi:hypothetical protein